jgi:hypothetical protein
MPTLQRLSALLLVALVAACHSPPREDAVELRTYDVPKGTASSLFATMKDVLWMGENKLIGRAVITPDGRLAVLATPSVQAGVQGLVDEVTRHPPASLAEPTVELHYFLVLGKAAASPSPYPPGVEEIKQGLDEIVRVQGPQTFTLAQRAGLSSLNDDEGRLDNAVDDKHVGTKLEIRQKAARTSDGVYARVSIRWNDDKVETRVHLEPDHIVVLGATGQHAGDAGDGTTLYYLVRVAPADGRRP